MGTGFIGMITYYVMSCHRGVQNIKMIYNKKEIPDYLRSINLLEQENKSCNSVSLRAKVTLNFLLKRRKITWIFVQTAFWIVINFIGGLILDFPRSREMNVCCLSHTVSGIDYSSLSRLRPVGQGPSCFSFVPQDLCTVCLLLFPQIYYVSSSLLETLPVTNQSPLSLALCLYFSTGESFFVQAAILGLLSSICL